MMVDEILGSRARAPSSQPASLTLLGCALLTKRVGGVPIPAVWVDEALPASSWGARWAG
jgi:hypothetical protein